MAHQAIFSLPPKLSHTYRLTFISGSSAIINVTHQAMTFPANTLHLFKMLHRMEMEHIANTVRHRLVTALG